MTSLCLILPSLLFLSPYESKVACRYESEIVRHASVYELDPLLVSAVIFVESSFNPSVVSHADACGLMQIVPKWTGDKETGGIKYNCDQLKDPETSIRVGTRILSYAISHYGKGDVRRGLCYYNAGTKCLRNNDYYKKLHYVNKVLAVRDKIKRKINR
jgi:soluble lytic murein transglycosylase